MLLPTDTLVKSSWIAKHCAPSARIGRTTEHPQGRTVRFWNATAHLGCGGAPWGWAGQRLSPGDGVHAAASAKWFASLTIHRESWVRLGRLGTRWDDTDINPGSPGLGWDALKRPDTPPPEKFNFGTRWGRVGRPCSVRHLG